MTDARGAGPSRRSVLAGTGLLLIAACKGSPAVVVPSLTADQRLARRVADEITVLAAAYAATITAHPTTRGTLGPLAAEHERHVAALAALLPAPTATPSGSAPPSGSASPSAAPSVASSATDAVAALAAAERVAAARRRGQALRAGAELARLLASIAACEAVHTAQVARLHATLAAA
jgi:sugar phosphate isomerase/epimerase